MQFDGHIACIRTPKHIGNDWENTTKEKKICKICVPDKIMVFDVNDREWLFFFLLHIN